MTGLLYPWGTLLISVIAGVVLVLGMLHHEGRGSIDSLSEAKLSPTFGSGYWLSEKNAGTEVWDEAVRACKSTWVDSPNCSVVLLVANEGKSLGVTSATAGALVPSHPISSGLTGRGAAAGGFPEPGR